METRFRAEIPASRAQPQPSGALVVAGLLLDRPLGPRHGLQAVVGDRLAALHRQSEGALREPLLGPLHRRQLLAQALGQAGVALGLEQLGTVVGHVLVDVRELLARAGRQVGKGLLDARALLREPLGRAFGVHGYWRPSTLDT